MGPVQLILVAIVAAVLLVATNRWAKQQRQELANLEPPPSLDSVGTWEEEVLAAQMAAEMAAANVRTPEPPPPSGPPSVPHDPPGDAAGALETVGGQAVLLQRHVPPRREARSHWGGLPSLPADLAWPSYVDQTGTDRALSFLVQVACDEVPADGRLGVFPDRGTLFVFAEMSWGHSWQWRCLYTAADVAGVTPTSPPASLPPAYDARSTWGWPQDDRDWPRLLPQWSFTPVLAGARTDELGDDEDPRLWPGRVDVERALDTIKGAVATGVDSDLAVDHVARPFPSFPHDWRAVLITFGHLSRALRQLGRRPGTDEALYARLRDDVATWTARAREHAPDQLLTAAEADAAWATVTLDRLVATTALRDAVPDAIEATLSQHPDPMSVLPDAALDVVRPRHSLASTYRGMRYARLPQRMLAPPTCVQVEGEERAAEWLLLLEVADSPAIGHHLAEGVLQFWIRPDDLAACRFDRVQLTAEAY